MYVRASALAHQANREIKDGYVVAIAADYKIAYQLIVANAPRVSDPVGKRGREFFEKLKKAYPHNTDGFKIAQVQTKLKVSYSEAQRFMHDLWMAGYLTRDTKEGKAYVYKIESDENNIPTATDFGLVHPDKLNCSKNQTVQIDAEQLDCTPVQAFTDSVQKTSEKSAEEKHTRIEIEV
jgi:hypothetical protein